MARHRIIGGSSWPTTCLCLFILINFAFAMPDKVPSVGGFIDQQSGQNTGISGAYKSSSFIASDGKQAKELSYGGNGGIQQQQPQQQQQAGSSIVAPSNSFGSFEYSGGSQGQAKDFGSTSYSTVGSSGYAGGSSGIAAAADTSYGPPSTGVHGGYQPPHHQPSQPVTHGEGPSYAYYYQHYPSGPGTNRPHHISPGEESFFDSMGDIGGLGLGGLGGIGGILAVAKGILALKPFLLFGLLLLLGIPLLLLFLPIPIITVSGLPGLPGTNTDGGGRQYGPSHYLQSYVSQISDRILNSEECLERLLCKMPQVPGKFQGKAKILWEQYGKKYFNNARVQRALTAYFDESAGTGRSRVSKCNQKFKCSNKLF